MIVLHFDVSTNNWKCYLLPTLMVALSQIALLVFGDVLHKARQMCS